MKFSFPVSLENQVREKEKQNIPDITEKLEGKRILLAEDNELNAEIAETVLEETGIKVKHVEDGKEKAANHRLADIPMLFSRKTPDFFQYFNHATSPSFAPMWAFHIA